MALRFQEIESSAPNLDDVVSQYNALETQFANAKTKAERISAIKTWNEIRCRLETWESLTELRFHQDTTDLQRQQERDRCDALRPKLIGLAVRFKCRLLESEHRAELEAEFGPQAFALWESEVTTFAPAIEEDLVRVSKLDAEYIELLASAEFEFQGETTNLSGIVKHLENPDREIRHEAERLRWGWYGANAEQLDRIFDQQVALRDGMAKKLGFADYVELGYRKMCRIDYNQDDVERFRAEIRQHVVPLTVELRKQQAKSLGLEELMFWDAALHDSAGNPRPRGDHDWMLARAREMFDAMGPDLGDFFRTMIASDLLDLKTRKGKAGGGFCTSFPQAGLPYIYANFNGSKGDVEVFTHEAGHAFQNYVSSSQPLLDYHWPTYESCEIHSMGLEFLTWPHMEKFFGDDAERFRRQHLLGAILFLPYGAAVDHFQHLVYAQPEASPQERHAMWQEMERLYLPWRNYGDLTRPAEGGFWQSQRHIYLDPFYYIDYALAQTCALQFWDKAEQDADAALTAYIRLCRLGGSAPFQTLAKSAGLVSPFEAGCLKDVVQRAGQWLGA